MSPEFPVGIFDYPSPSWVFQFFDIESRPVAVTVRGAGGCAWVWADGEWRFAPGLANKEGVPLSAREFTAEFPDAGFAALVTVVYRAA
jgi:hypothetical protein